MDTECCLRVSLWRGSPLETYALYFVFIQMGSSPLRMTRARTELPSPSLWWPFSSAPVLASCFPFLLSLQKVSLGTQHVQTSLSSLSLSTLSILLFSLRSRVTESLSQWSQNLKLWVLSLITISEFQSPRLLSCILPKSTSPPPSVLLLDATSPILVQYLLGLAASLTCLWYLLHTALSWKYNCAHVTQPPSLYPEESTWPLDTLCI